MEEKKKSSLGAYKNLILFAAMMIVAVIIVAVKPSGKSYTASAPGIYGKDVTVTITVDNAGTITKAVVDVSNETENLGAAIGDTMEAEILEAQSNQIDVVAGCTVSSDAVISALTDAMKAAGLEVQGQAAQGGDGYTATAQGAMGPVTVYVTFDDNGVITGLEIDASAETETLGQVAAPKLQEQILAAGTIEGIDAIASCTMTSNAIFEAITDCMEQAAK